MSQLLLAATVANLTLVATNLGLMRGRRRRQNPADTHACAPFAGLVAICRYFAVAEWPAVLPTHPPLAGFRPRF